MQIDRPIIIAIILFAILLLSFFLVVPKYKTLGALSLDLAQKEAEFNAQYDYFSEIVKKYDEIQKRKDDIKIIDDALPQVSNFGQLIFYFQKQTKDTGVNLKSISLSQSAAGVQNMKSTSFSLHISGDYASLENFIVSLEKSARIFEITSISFGSPGASVSKTSDSEEDEEQSQFQNQEIFDFSLEVKTFSY